MDTIGNIIDKMFTVNMKMQYNKSKPERIKNLEEQRIALAGEIDTNVNKIFRAEIINDIDVVRPQHKTY